MYHKSFILPNATLLWARFGTCPRMGMNVVGAWDQMSPNHRSWFWMWRSAQIIFSSKLLSTIFFIWKCREKMKKMGGYENVGDKWKIKIWNFLKKYFNNFGEKMKTKNWKKKKNWKSENWNFDNRKSHVLLQRKKNIFCH